MKKKYVIPELETVKFDLKDTIMSSPLESSIPENIGGDNEGEPGSGLEGF